MIRYIAFLRGINVSGQKRVPMVELRELLNTLGFKNVQTYIQSGNVVFDALEKETSVLEANISNIIEQQFGFQVPVLVITNRELKGLFKSCPFLEKKKVSSYFTLLNTAPEMELLETLNSMVFNNEEIVVTSSCVYFYSEMGYGKAKCNTNFIERKLKVSATTRNYKTISKLLELSEIML